MQRHRNPANGYRSNPIGGVVSGGGPGYRSYNRGGFGRGQPKVFQSGSPQPPPPRRVDVFFEAGKLATEYLVSKGLIAPNSVNGKWQNSNLKNQIGGGDGVPDSDSGTGGGRRRFPDEVKARRTMGSFKNPGFEWNRSASLSEKVKDGDSVSGSIEEQKSEKDGASEDQKSVSEDLESRNNESSNLESTIENKPNQLPDDNVGIKTPISDESTEKTDVLKNEKISTPDDCKKESESEKPIVKEEPINENNTTDENNNTSSDLLTLIRSNKVPTRTRSSVTLKSSKSDSVLISGDESKNKIQNPEEPASSLQDVSMATDENQEQKPNHDLKIEVVPSEETATETDQKLKFGHGVCTRSQSFPQRSAISEQDYNRCNSVVLGRGEKRPLIVNDDLEGSKKPRDWDSSNVQDGYFNLSNLKEDQSSSQMFAEEKQLFPNSFKICDLNLMGASDANDNNHDTNSIIGFQSTKQETVPVDFDLTMNSSCDMTNRQTRHGSDGKGVEVIDLDCDSGQDDKDFSNSERREDGIFTDLESFPDSMQRVSDIPQDGYGLMISELLEADIPNSTTGVSSMHNEITLQNEEGMLGDDESIYMSLGEIPISFVPVWDQQPSQGYDKRY